MRSYSFLVGVALFPGLALLAPSSPLHSQAAGAAVRASAATDTLPDAPSPSLEPAQAGDSQSAQPPSPPAQPQSSPAQPPSPPAQQNQSPAPNPAPASVSGAQSSSSAQSSAPQSGTQETEHQKAAEQIKEQEHQRIAGIVPSFNVTYLSDAATLTPAQKFQLQFRSAIDPYTFSIAIITAALGEAENSNTGLGWGPSGFAERSAAAYGDNVIGNTLGNAVLPSLLHQDPRYFRLGHGSVRHRLLYAFATAFICKHDNTRKWEPNYSNVLGNMIAGEISTLYYPNSKSDATQAIETGLTVTFEGAFGSELQEFWPDMSRKFFHKDPTHGLDAQARAADAAQQQKKQQQEEDQKHQ